MKHTTVVATLLFGLSLAAGPAHAAGGAKGYFAKARVVTDAQVRHRDKRLDKYGTCQSLQVRLGPGGIDKMPIEFYIPKAALMPQVPAKLRIQQRDARNFAEDRQLVLAETAVKFKRTVTPLKLVLKTKANGQGAELNFVLGQVSGSLAQKQAAELAALKSTLKPGGLMARALAYYGPSERKMRYWGIKLSTSKNPDSPEVMLSEIDAWLQTGKLPRPMNNRAWVGQIQALLNQAGQNMLRFRKGELEPQVADAQSRIRYITDAEANR